ncbi:MAG: acyltransferase domain-containing protein [Geminicoccaceae bacterium]
MALAILCSGQGRQHPDMFALTGDVPEAASLFAHAATLLDGRDPRELVRTATSETLHHNRVGQILCSLQALAAATALRSELPGQLIVAGYSVGEVAAWGVAGLLDMKDTLDLVARRAEAMDAVTLPGDGLLFVRGLARNTIDRLCEQHDAAIAIVNPGDAFVIGGSGAALEGLIHEAKAMHATRVVLVPVEVAAHTKRLAGASTAFRENLSQVSVRAPRTTDARLLSGIDGAPVIDAEAGLDKLAAQISQTVQWADCLQGCIEGGATVMLELGPGPALSEMAAGAYRDVPARSLENFRTLQGIRAWVG